MRDDISTRPAIPVLPASLSADAFRLLRLMADGLGHTRSSLQSRLRVSSGALQQLVASIETEFGVPVREEPETCYRLQHVPDLFDRSALAGMFPDEPWRVEILDVCESTNTLLSERVAAGAPNGSVIACEHQRSGRGRRGARWVSSVGGSLAFSLLWRFDRRLADLSGLSLAVAVGVVRALHSMGAEGVRLKWPNDLLFEGRKLGGILIEASEDAQKKSAAVIGIGLNVRLGERERKAIDVPVADLAETGHALSRTQSLGRLLLHLTPVLRQFEREGFEPFRAEWMTRHAWQQKQVALELAGRPVARGEAVGVDVDGALLLRSGSLVERHHVGQISLRAQ